MGQADLAQDGLNLVQGVELYSPSGIALDQRGGAEHIYISDTHNCRILGWKDVASYQVGDAPTIVLGQLSLQTTAVMAIGSKGLNTPLQIAVDPKTGNLYVADYGNNRILRFPSPFDNPTGYQPDAVYGQSNFTTYTAGLVSANSLKQPRSVAFDSSGNLWVADTGNNRILRYSAASLNGAAPVSADTVIGQTSFVSGASDGGGSVSNSGLDAPWGLAFDAQDNLYVADYNNTRVVRFAAPLGPSVPKAGASLVWGETGFTARGVSGQAGSSTLTGPVGVAVDSSGNLYVSTSLDNRVLIFPAAGPGGVSATAVLGQPDFSTTTANTGSYPLASANTLSGPLDVKTDKSGNVFVADSGNNRVLQFPATTKSANKVWGQNDFTSSGPNRVKPASINFPYQVVIDYSKAPYALYVSDTGNNRILIWKDSVRFRSGDPADLVIGQPNLLTAAANIDSGAAQTPTSTSLSSPTGLALNQSNGSLYVADAGNNRILRFPRPVDQTGRITPDAVIGQSTFTTSAAGTVSAASLNAPGGLALGPNGDLFVADTGNNRVLEFPGNGATAIRVYGQPGMTVSARPGVPSAQTLSAPWSVFVDQATNLYVADTGSNRVLIFPNTTSAPSAGSVAAAVIGPADFSGTTGAVTLKSPTGVGVDSVGNVYVGDNGNNRVLVFSWPGYLTEGASPASVVGQNSLTSVSADWDGQNGLATADSMYGPVAIYLDRQDTLYVGDSGNNRVLQFLKAAVPSNAATLLSSNPIAPGAIATLMGSGLAGSTALAPGASWPTTLLNRQIVLNDQLVAPLYYVSPTQANFQLPSNTPVGKQRISVQLADTGELVAGGNVIVGATAPGIFTLSQDGTGQAAARNQDNSINGTGNPAAVGSTIQIFGTGQGQVSPVVTDGSPAGSAPLSYSVAVPTADSKTCFTTQPSMCVAIGNAFGAIQYSGLAPGFIGLWQLNVTIPAGTPSGNVNLVVVINGTSSNSVKIAVK